MRVTYDTNSLVRIFARRGEMLVFRELVLTKQITLITSDFILDEAEEVLASKLGLTKQKAKIAVRTIARIATVVKPDEIEKVSRDPDDDYILATAVKSKSEYLVTADKDLLILTEYNGVKIISPNDFRSIVG
jgi:putative PIN family toxin of toxin-antitoxin system